MIYDEGERANSLLMDGLVEMGAVNATKCLLAHQVAHKTHTSEQGFTRVRYVNNA